MWVRTPAGLLPLWTPLDRRLRRVMVMTGLVLMTWAVLMFRRLLGPVVCDYVGVAVLPSTMVIYGIVVMFTLNRPVGPAASPGLFGIGVLAGVALLITAILQGECCAAAINASKSKPEIFGISVTPAAIVEGFAVFAFVFALVVSGAIPKG